jgi:hypothetical protein
MKGAFRIRDLAVIVLFLLLALALFFVLRQEKADFLVVEIEGEVVERIPCSELETPLTRVYRGALGDVEITVHEGSVSVSKSDCPTGQCLHSGAIASAGQCIVCLPNRFSVYFEGGDVDGVTG